MLINAHKWAFISNYIYFQSWNFGDFCSWMYCISELWQLLILFYFVISLENRNIYIFCHAPGSYFDVLLCFPYSVFPISFFLASVS